MNEGEAAGGRRRQIMEIAAQIFARKGYRGTSMRDIGEAAGVLGGTNMFWKMHKWLWPNFSRFNMDNFKKVSRGFGLDPEVFAEKLESKHFTNGRTDMDFVSWVHSTPQGPIGPFQGTNREIGRKCKK